MSSATATIRLGVDLAGLQTGLQQAATIAEQKGHTIKAALMRATDSGVDGFKNMGSSIASTLNPINLVTGALGSMTATLGIGAGAAGLGGMIAASITAADSMADLSIKTGIQVEQLSRFSTVAKLSGTSMDEVAGIVKKLSISAVGAYSGNEKLARSFDALGISTKELKGISPDELLIRIAKGIQGIDPMIVQELMAQLGGRGAMNVLPFLRELTERIDTTRVKIGSQFAKDAKEFNDNITLMQSGVMSISNKLTSDLLPSLNAVLIEINKGNVAWGSFGNAFAASNVDWKGDLSAQLAHAELKRRELQMEQSKSFMPWMYDDKLKDYELRISMLQNRISSVKTKLNPDIDIQKNEAARIAALLNNKPTMASAGNGFLQGLQTRIEKADQGEYAMLRLQAAEKGVTEAAAPLIDQLKRIDEAKAVSGYENDLTRQNTEIEYQTSLIGKSATQVAMLNVEHRMQLDLAKQIEQLERSKGALSDNSIARMRAATNESILLQQNSISERLRQEQSFQNGLQSSLAKYADESSDYAKMTEGAFTRAFSNMETSLAGFISTGQADFSKLADGIISDLSRIMIKALIIGPIVKSLGIGGDGLLSGGGLFGSIADFLGFRDGATFAEGKVTAFADGGVVNRPTIFPMARGIGLMGEAGPEAIMPLRRDARGRLGVISGQQSGQSINNITINNYNERGSEVTATAESNGSGGIDVLVNVIRKTVASDIMRGGDVAQSLRAVYNLNRVGR